MCRLVKMGQLFVHSIDCKSVLDKIVRSDTEEIDLGCEHVGRDCRARNFDHRANLDLFAYRNARLVQLILALSQHRLGAAQLLQARDHRKHDFYVSYDGSTKDSAQLCLKDVYVL